MWDQVPVRMEKPVAGVVAGYVHQSVKEMAGPRVWLDCAEELDARMRAWREV